MDLDFSFALVSSLTPRSHITRTPLSDTNKLSSSKAPKIKQKLNLNPQNCDKIKQLSNKENQNNIPKDQQMNENVAQTRVSDSNFIEEKCKDDSTSICFPLDMANIAVRRSKVRSRRRKPSSLQEDNNSLRSPCKDTKIHSSTLSSKNSFCCSLKICCDKQNIPSILSNEDFICSRASLNSDNIDICTKQSIESSVVIKGVKRKSLRLSELSSISTDVIESSELEFKINESNNSFSNNSVLISECAKLGSIRLKNLRKSSLSPAYDSDSFKVPRRQGVKAILETPETDKSLESNLNSTEDRKVILETPESDKTLESNLNSSEDVKSLQKETKEIEKQKGSINISDHYRENINLKTCKGLNVESSLDKDNKFIDLSINTPESDENPKKKLRSSKDSSVSDLFKLEPSIKNQPSTIKSDQINFNLTEKDKRKQSLSPVLKDINTKDVDSKTTVLRKGKQSRRDKPMNRKKTLEEEENKCKPSRISLKEKNNKNSPIIVCSPKSNLIPPTEVIPKFEHISNWLKDTQEKSASLVSSDFSIDSSKEREKKPPGRSKLLSLSPRIKNKKKIAESTLREEQKLFEELYGDDLANRLSDDVEDVISIASSNEPVQLSEKVLEKLYGTVWQKSAVLPQSEPRKGRKNTSSLQKNVPLTERKKKRTSIYDVFSSSSSEDRFEEFLESVQRGKLDSVRRGSNQPDSPEFINDSDSDSNTSVGFYHTIVTKAVKEDAKSLRDKAADGAKNPRKVNRRRLSFTSSKDEWSEGEKLDTKLDKSDTISIKDTKKKNRKRRSKKKTEDFDNKISANVNDFTLVTPLKVKDKKDSSELSEIIKKVIECAEPKSVGKSKNLKKLNKKVNNPSSEENFRKKYLGADGFKVPTNISSFKTPTKQPSATVLSSPALSFLSSLSEMTAGLPCHPDALVYKKDFKNKREELTKKLFNLFNKEVFDDKLPADMLIQWSARMTSTSGYCYNKRIYINNQIFRSSRIVLSTKILDRADRLRDTLVHEMCHAATWIVNATSDGHGPNWKAWADKANSRFPELPVIKRCHDYAISTKFTYKCMSCGYCIGRHSKSLDTDRKRCGYCYGKFQVFVTAKMSAASATSGSDSVKTQRNPTGFALFVKEHYAAVKKQHNVPHGQVMKLLSQKFADVKISKQSAAELLLVE